MEPTEGEGLVAGVARRVHLVGIGGAGLSGAARILFERGHEVSGSDRAGGRFVNELARLGIDVFVGTGERPALDPAVGLVARSAAVPLDDPDCARALERGLPVLKYGELLGRIAPLGRTLAVAGTHGKTSSAWMLLHALRGVSEALGRGAPAPGALIGGIDRAVGCNALAPRPGGWFAAEACEYDRSFLQLKPAGAIVTNVEADHLDYYGSLDAIVKAFARFAARVQRDGLLVLGSDVPESIEAAVRCEVWRLGHELKVELLGQEHGRFRFRLIGPGWATPRVSLSVPGSFNVDNAALALALAIGHAGRVWHLAPELVAQRAAAALERYLGCERRFESWGMAGGVEVVHDYAHHPTEVRVTLEAARRALPGRPLYVLFQPHQHSRTARFMGEFVESLRGVERAVIADVYGARAHIDAGAPGPEGSSGAEELASRLRRAGVDAVAAGDLTASVAAALERLPGGSALFVLGAGDVEGIRDELIAGLAMRSPELRGSLR